MVSKNNLKNKLEQDAKKVPHYGIRKLSIGVASVLLGTTLYFGANSVAYGDTINSDDSASSTSEIVNSRGENQDNNLSTAMSNNATAQSEIGGGQKSNSNRSTITVQ